MKARHTFTFDEAPSLGGLAAALDEIVAAAPNPNEEPRRMTMTLDTKNGVRSITVYDD